MLSEFEKVTIDYLKEADISYRKEKGQYFTPKTIRQELLAHLPNDIKSPRILDPACGTGEFLLSAEKSFDNPQLYGWDIDVNVVSIARKLVPEAEIKQTDALKEKLIESFDFVIGNPPYYEFTPTKEVKEKYGDIMGGRANIFGLFIKIGLSLLKEGGYLAYVLPPSMNNGAYFSNLRKLIVDNSNIEYLKILDNVNLFHSAQQMVMLLILKKGKNKGDYLFKHNGILIFSEKVEYLKNEFKGKTTLHDLGYSVKTGRLVWNQNKELLTNDPTKGIPLVWARNIKDGKIQLDYEKKYEKKPQYVKIRNFDVGPAIIVNRITGAAKSAKLKAAIIEEDRQFIAENHCNVIFPPSREWQARMDFEEKREISLEAIAEQLQSPEKMKVIQNITGNTQISKTELEKLFPIDI